MTSLRPGWKRVRFGDMVTSAGATRKARGWSAKEAGVDRYVGLEHLDSHSLKIRRWGSPQEVGQNSDLRPFGPGDVILARRGIELRKIGVAEFHGVASGHALVFRARPQVVLPEFLPFFMQSDVFMNRADRFSVGSLSRTVNLSALVREEFPLPPLEEQQRISAVLVQARVATEAHETAATAAELLRRAVLLDAFRPGRGSRDEFPRHWRIAPAATVGGVQLGQQRHPKFDQGSNIRPYLRVANVMDGWLDLTDVLSMHFPKRDLVKFELRPGDILLNEGQSYDLVGRSAIYRGEIDGCCFQKTLLRFRCGAELLPEFAQAYFQHRLYTGQFAALCVQTTSMAHLTAVRFAAMPVPVPPMAEQRAIIDRVAAAGEAGMLSRQHLERAKQLMRSLMNSLLR